MIQPEQEKKTGILDKLPKLGRISQLVLVIGVFLILFVVLIFTNNQQQSTRRSLEATLANLQKVSSVEQTPKTKYEAELAQVTAEMEAAKAVFPSTSNTPEILDTLLSMAELNDIYVTQTKVSTTTQKGAIGPLLTIELGLSGQTPKFQNFLLALDDKLPTSWITQLTFTIAGEEAAEDTAKITISIQCYEGDR